MDSIVIIGAGKMGKAIARILGSRKATIRFWDKKRGKVPGQKELALLIPQATMVFLAVPSSAVREAAEAIQPLLRRGTIIVSIAKGLEAKTGFTVDQVLLEALPGQPAALLSGPMLASELMRGLPGAAVAASKSVAATSRLTRLFNGTALRVRVSKDVRGTAFAGVLKNIYTLLLGASDGLGFGWNAKGLLAGEAANEMAALLPVLGGKRETAHAPAGFGDLVATGMSPASWNYRTGYALASGGAGPRQSEGTASVPLLFARLGTRARNFPLLSIARLLVVKPSHGRKALIQFIKTG